MKTVCWMGTTQVEIRDVPEPRMLNQHDVIMKVSCTGSAARTSTYTTAFVRTMQRGGVLGHEFMGEVAEVGSAVKNVKSGDRVLVRFPITRTGHRVRRHITARPREQVGHDGGG